MHLEFGRMLTKRHKYGTVSVMDTTFIYFLKDPENPMKGYVGKTDRPRKRLSDHYTECRDKTHRRANWLTALATRKLKPTLQVVDEVPFEHWPQLEVAYIEFFLEQGYELVNGTPGGDAGPVLRGEKNAQFGKPGPHLGKKFTQDTCEKMSKAATGENNPFFGHKHSPDTRKKWDRSGTKNSMFDRTEKHSPEHCAKRRIKKPGASSKFYGVCWAKEVTKWRSVIHVSGKKISLGFFSDEVEAARAYDVAAKTYHSAHAKLNFPD